jgi:hypothetical protein
VIGKDVNIMGRLMVQQYTQQNIINTTTTNYTLIVSENLSLNGNLSLSGNGNVAGILNVGNTTASTTSTDGAFVVSGGVGVAGDINGNGNIKTTGNISTSYNISTTGGGYITSATTITATGTLTAGNISTGGAITATGNLTAGNITTAGTVTAASFNATSDYRIKYDVTDLDESFVIDGVRPVEYYVNDRKEKNYGVIADELQQVYPCLVTGEKDGEQLQSVNYIGIIPLLINEIKNLKKAVKALQERGVFSA